MKHSLMVLVAAVAMISSTGCLGLHGQCGCGAGACETGNCGANCGGCAKCGHGSHFGHLCHRLFNHGRNADDGDGYPGPREMTGDGPPTGAVSYPYYTTRGPRDFLMNNPPSIGR